MDGSLSELNAGFPSLPEAIRAEVEADQEFIHSRLGESELVAA